MDNTQQQASGAAPSQQGAGAQQSQDYGDKAFGMLSKKTGHSVSRETGEKITDGARGVFEKVTG